MITLQDIQDAARRLQGQVLDTPCVESKTLSQIVGAQIFLKFENLQFTASFKERGACEYKLDGTDTWLCSNPGEKFSIPGNSKFDIRVTESYHYICHFG